MSQIFRDILKAKFDTYNEEEQKKCLDKMTKAADALHDKDMKRRAYDLIEFLKSNEDYAMKVQDGLV